MATTTTVAQEAPVSERQRFLGYLALAASVVGIGSAIIFVRFSEVDPTATLMLRMVAASLMLAVVTVPSNGTATWREVSRRDVVLLILSSMVAGLDLLSNQWAVHHTSVANTALLINLSPVFVLLLAWVFLRQRTSGARIAAVGVAVAGAGLMVVGGGDQPSFPENHLFGDALAVLSAFLYAVYLMLTKDLRARVPTPIVMLSNSICIAVVLLPVAMATSSPVLPQTFGGYLLIVVYALVSQLLGHGLMTYALRVVDVNLASLSSLVRPLVAVALGWLLLDEAVGVVQALGGAGVLAGLGWFQYLGRPAATAAGRVEPGTAPHEAPAATAATASERGTTTAAE